MDKSPQNNRVNQCNPTHSPTGPGHKAGYQGNTEKATMDNKANQGNPNNEATKGSTPKK